MSIQLQGTGLVIKGRAVINSASDANFNILSASSINIKTGGVNINGDSNISGDLVVRGEIYGNVNSSTQYSLLKKYNDCLVQLMSEEEEDKYHIFSGVFITSDGWVLSSYECVKNSNTVWGTIMNPTLEKKMDVLKAHHIFVDKLTGLCVIKFPDIENHNYLKWADTYSGEECYSLLSPIHPVAEFSARKGSIQYTKIEYDKCDCVVCDIQLSPGDPIINSNGELITVALFEYKNGAGGPSKLFGQYSSNFMISKLQDYLLENRGWLGMIESSEMTHLHVITSGLLGVFSPKGVIIEQTANNSPLENCMVLSGNVITHIDGIELNNKTSINAIIMDKQPKDTIDITYINPPSIVLETTSIVLDPLPHEGVFNIHNTSLLEPKLVIKKPYNINFAQTNNKNAKEIYDATHEEEIKYRKKMYLVDRLKIVKNRKRVKSRVRSRKR